VSSLTWDNPCSFAPVAVRARNVYYRRRRRLRSNSQQMPLKNGTVADVVVTASNRIEVERRRRSYHATPCTVVNGREERPPTPIPLPMAKSVIDLFRYPLFS